MVAICIYSRAYDDVRVPIVYAESLSQADKQRELARPRSRGGGGNNGKKDK